MSEQRHPQTRLDRREFFHTTAAAAMLSGTGAGGALFLPGCARPNNETSRRRSFPLEEATFEQLQQKMETGELSCEQITRLYLERIEELNFQGPSLHHVVETNPEALEIARGLDQERSEGSVRGPLHGIPVLLKDNIDTADKMTTTAGSLALEGWIPAKDSFVAAKLRGAGAVLLGKANLSEWANFRSTQSSSGWSGRGGQTRNPYVLDRNPCGSSSGSGAATAANLCAAAVGTETDGSIVCPAAANSVVGIKPSLGLVSRSGIIPIAHSQDTAGPMARTVTDAAILLGALVGADPTDPITAESPGPHDDYTRFLDRAGLQDARIGVARGPFFGYSPEADGLVEEAIAAMRHQGAVVIDPVEIPHAQEYGDSEFTVLLYEFKADLNAYLEKLGSGAGVSSLEDLIRWNEEHAENELIYFGQDIFEMAQEKGPLTDKEYLDALVKNRRLSREEGLDSVLAEQRLDAIVAPTGSPAWPIDLVNGDHFLGASSGPAAVSGYASLTLPVGYSFDLPVGMTFIGGRFSEPTLIRLAFALEQTLQARRAPGFLPTVQLPAGKQVRAAGGQVRAAGFSLRAGQSRRLQPAGKFP